MEPAPMLRFSIRDVLWLTLVVGLIVGHFVTLRLDSRSEVLRQQQAEYAEQVDNLYAEINQRDEELQALRDSLVKAQQAAEDADSR